MKMNTIQKINSAQACFAGIVFFLGGVTFMCGPCSERQIRCDKANYSVFCEMKRSYSLFSY